MRSRIRFIVAITLAVALGSWLAWTSLGGALETYAGPGELTRSSGDTYRLNGLVATGSPADAPERARSAEGLRFTVVDKETPDQRVEVLYRGSVPDAFRDGREIVVVGAVDARGTFIAEHDSMIALCPSKFSDRPEDHLLSGT
jgi:cytochrome c-type biogenesis protein CcmE